MSPGQLITKKLLDLSVLHTTVCALLYSTVPYLTLYDINASLVLSKKSLSGYKDLLHKDCEGV